jgi:YteA family regulatory protein
MDKSKLDYFKNMLLQEKEDVTKLLAEMKDNYTIAPLNEMDSELSYYDNHGADIAGNLNDYHRGIALKHNEESIMNKIQRALADINNGDYGVCKVCGKAISEERLKFIPYADHCVNCQNHLTNKNREDLRPVEEQVLGRPFARGFNDDLDKVSFDAEDSYQAVGRFNAMENVYEEYEDEKDFFVDPMDLISNEQYRNQLPD